MKKPHRTFDQVLRSIDRSLARTRAMLKRNRNLRAGTNRIMNEIDKTLSRLEKKNRAHTKARQKSDALGKNG